MALPMRATWVIPRSRGEEPENCCEPVLGPSRLVNGGDGLGLGHVWKWAQKKLEVTVGESPAGLGSTASLHHISVTTWGVCRLFFRIEGRRLVGFLPRRGARCRLGTGGLRLCVCCVFGAAGLWLTRHRRFFLKLTNGNVRDI